MKKKKFIFLFILFIVFGVCAFVKAEETTQDSKAPSFKTAKELLTEGGKDNFNTGVDKDELYRVIGRGIESVLGVIGIILIIIVIYAGYLWFSAQGNEDQVTQSKTYITNAVIGLVIVLLAYAITYFVMSKITGIIADI